MKLALFRETVFDTCRLSAAQPVLVGVSGGPDSLCLLDNLLQLGLTVIAAHFDHQLRRESAQDAETVRQIAAQLGVPFVLGSQDVAHFAAIERLSLEEAARRLRYFFLFDQARQWQAQAVAVAHTADDQVETVLMHLLRGAGINGMAGMRYRTVLPDWDPAIPLVRPLLDTWRTETVSYCRERGFTPVMDPSNQETIFFRNRIRHEVIPFLETLNPHVRQNIWRTAHLLDGDAQVVQAAVEAAWLACLVEQQPGAVALQREVLQSMTDGMLRAVLRQGIAQCLPDLRDINAAAVERAVRYVRSPVGGKVELGRGLYVFAEAGRLWIAGGAPLPVPLDWPQLDSDEMVPVPGELPLPSGWNLTCAWVEREAIPEFSGQFDLGWEVWLDADSLPDCLCLRRPRPGDRFQPLGMEGHSQKLSDFWVNEKLPRRARAAWPLLAAEDAILWVPGFRPAHPFRITPATRRALHVRLYREP